MLNKLSLAYNDTKWVVYGSIGGRDHGEYIGVDLVKKSNIFAMRKNLFFHMEPLDPVRFIHIDFDMVFE